MAEGVLVLLIGPDLKKNQAEFQAADKEYEFDLLFGFSTDTYDALGLIVDTARYDPDEFPADLLRREISGWIGSCEQEVPPFSSIVVRGRPLFWWAREGRLGEVGLPVREIQIMKAELTGTNQVSKRELEVQILSKIDLIQGDFRQIRIKEGWRSALNDHPNDRFLVATIRMTVGSGTYIRSVAHTIGKALGIPSLALRILRTRNGPFDLIRCQPVSDLFRP